MFGAFFQGLDQVDLSALKEIPEDWLRETLKRTLSEEDKAKLEALGFEKLIEEFKKRLEEQQGRHAGGNRWIGTGGTSPFGAGGYHP